MPDRPDNQGMRPTERHPVECTPELERSQPLRKRLAAPGQ